MTLDLARLRDLTRGAIGAIDVACPLCGPERRNPVNRNRKVLRIWDDGVFVTFKCARCEVSGWARGERAAESVPRRAEAPAVPDPDRIELARFLWSRAKPAEGTQVEAYLRARQCPIVSESLGYLPPRAEHPAAMIARFGQGEVTGVHLTKLIGNRKAGTEKDKVMIGPSAGQPIVVCDNPERGELIVTEGIEDAASLASVTGWTAWAAGAAGRIPLVMPSAAHFERIFLAVDDDKAGKVALERSMSIRADIVPLRLAKVFGLRASIDANKAIRDFGADALLAAVEWCDAQTRFKRGEIGFHAMKAAIHRAEQVFAAVRK